MTAFLASFLQKLWDKGVDIVAGIITSVLASILIALIGLAGWRFKLLLDLRAAERKQRQEHRVGQELERERLRQEARAQHTRLIKERDGFADAVRTQGRQGQAELWDRYLRWMELNGLQHLAGNGHFYELAGWASGLRIASEANVAVNAKNMEKLIRNTELPESGP